MNQVCLVPFFFFECRIEKLEILTFLNEGVIYKYAHSLLNYAIPTVSIATLSLTVIIQFLRTMKVIVLNYFYAPRNKNWLSKIKSTTLAICRTLKSHLPNNPSEKVSAKQNLAIRVFSVIFDANCAH